MAHDVFISYSSVNRRIADAVCKQLESDGFACWVAPRDIVAGRKWSEAIIDALAGSRVMVLILSAHSIASEQVEREVERAAARRLPIIPFRVEDVPMSKVLEYFISTPHWLNAWDEPLEPHLAELSRAVSALLSKSPGSARPAPVPAPAPASPPAMGKLDAAQLARVTEELAVFVGPMAKVLVRRAAASASSFVALREMLAGEIHSEADRKRFLQNMGS